MSDNLEYIESYFEQKLTVADKELFEQRCSNDEDFAADVAFYISTRQAVRLSLLEQKRLVWQKAAQQQTQPASVEAPVRKMFFSKWLPYAAAACILAAIAFFSLKGTNSPPQMASEYLAKNMAHISGTMDGSRDSMQAGINFYNLGKYDTALSIFNNYSSTHPENSNAKQYAGMAYLASHKYTKALAAFDELAQQKLFSNPGLFYKAVTLLNRDEMGDKDAARKLLQQVKDKNLEGSKQATEWLANWR